MLGELQAKDKGKECKTFVIGKVGLHAKMYRAEQVQGICVSERIRCIKQYKSGNKVGVRQCEGDKQEWTQV